MAAVQSEAARRPYLEAFTGAKSGAAARGASVGDPDVENARLTGIEEGRRLGVADGRAQERAAIGDEIEQAVAAALEEQKRRDAEAATSGFIAALSAWGEERAAASARIEEMAKNAIALAVEAVLPQLARDGFAQEVAQAAAARLSRVAGEGGGRFRVAPEAAEQMSAALAEHFGPDSPWETIADPQTPAGAATAEWRDGFASFDLAGAADEIAAAAKAALAPESENEHE